MNLIIKTVLFVWLALCSGCASQKTIDQIISQYGADCVRHYAGNLGGMVATFSFSADCQPSGTVTTTTVTVPAKP